MESIATTMKSLEEKLKLRQENIQESEQPLQYSETYIQSLMSKSRIGKRFIEKDFNNFIGDIPKKLCLDYCSNFKDNEKEGRGLYLWGQCGTGKTHLLSAIAKNLIKQGIELKYYSTVELFLKLKSTFDTKTATEDSFFKDLNKQARVLILDDIGSERYSEWVMQEFYILINRRYEDLQPTLFTSNLSIEDLANKFNDRIASRIVGMCDVIEIKGSDFRLRR